MSWIFRVKAHICLLTLARYMIIQLGFIYLLPCVYLSKQNNIQSNLDSSNTDGSFTMANSNSFLSPYEILPIAQENKYLWKFSYFIVKLYVVCTH